MRAIQVTNPGSDFALAERPVPEPAAGAVRVKVTACGICHGDVVAKEGHWPNLTYPRVPGHEVAGVVDALGPGVTAWAPGDRVGVGWHGGHCGQCDPCRSGDFTICRNLQITGLHFDGGYAQYMIVPATGLARIPGALCDAEAAPLLCAGMTTFNSLRHSRALAGDLVAVHGIGGLGHLGIQFARQFGFHTVAISRGRDKEELALRLGAHRYIDSAAADPAAELARLGGARVILATAPHAGAISALIGGLGRNGMLLAVAASTDPLAISTAQLIGRRLSLQGWPSGTPKDSEDTMNFCARTGVRAMIEQFPLEEAAQAYRRMMTNQVRFRAVLLNR